MNLPFTLGILFSFSKVYASLPPSQPIRPKPVVIAVVDTGTDINHKDLKEFIWTNTGESGLDSLGKRKESNQIDDDGNGYVDDVHGWNFIDNTNQVFDDHGHGTHIAGLITKEFKEPQLRSAAKIMILKYYDASSRHKDTLQLSTAALRYAVKMNADLINYSGGGSESNSKELEVLRLAEQKKIIVVAAAGNNSENSDVKPFFPANYFLSNIISVAAVDKQGQLLNFSNYGRNSVDLAAPGKGIFSTMPLNSYGVMSGTSQATGNVSGRMARLIFETQERSREFLLERLLGSARKKPSLVGKLRYGAVVESLP